ncbi:MAG: general stress protein [Pseudonocardiaceae bacterium]
MRFPVQRVAIVGHDLRVVEQVTGRFNYGGAALKGAGSGALFGALIGWIFGLFSLFSPLVASVVLAFYGLIAGAVIGAVFGLVAHALQRGRRDFDAVTMTVPSRFEVLADDDVADEAMRLLADAPREQVRDQAPTVR